MTPIEIKIRTEASGTGAQSTEKGLKDLSQAAKKVAADIAVTEKQLAKLQTAGQKQSFGQKLTTGVTDAIKEIPVVGSFFSALNGATGYVGAGLLAIGAGFKIAGDSLRAFAAGEVEMAKLDAALANSGQLTDAYREKLEKLADSRSRSTGIDDEKYLGVFTTLTKFGADTSNIESYTKAVENLAGFMGGDMEQAAFLFGKAMTGSTEMLGRYGIHVDKSLSQTDQLADIMRQLESRGAGQLEAMGATLQGSFAKMKNGWDELLKAMGSSAANSGLSEYLTKFGEGLRFIADKLRNTSDSKSENKQVLLGDTPAKQAEADKITRRQQDLDSSNAFLKKDKAAAERELKSGALTSARRKELKDIIAADASALAANAKVQSELSGLSKAPGLQPVSPAEADRRSKAASFEQESDAGYSAVKAAAAFARMSPENQATDLARQLKRASEDTAKAAPDQKSEAGKAERAIYEKLLAAEQQVSDAKANQAAAREAIDAQLALNEAIAAGNDKEAERLKWMQDYTKLLAEAQAAGAGDDSYGLAIRGASAAMGPAKELPYEKSSSSAAHALGTGRDEVYVAQATLVSETKRVAALVAKSNEHLSAISKKKGGYQ